MQELKSEVLFAENASFAAGRRLREQRERQGLTLRHVEELTAIIAAKLNNLEFSVPMSRLSDIETKGVLPSIYRLYALAAVYKLSTDEVLGWYGIQPASLGGFRFSRTRRPIWRLRSWK